jgi:hypothetical protein
MTEFEGEVLAELSVLKAQMQQLLGVGQPGRLTHLEEKVERQEQTVQRLKGLAGAFGVLLTVAHLALVFFRK